MDMTTRAQHVSACALPLRFDSALSDVLHVPNSAELLGSAAEVLGAAFAFQIAEHRQMYQGVTEHTLDIATTMARTDVRDLRGIAVALALLRDGSSATMREALIALGQVQATADMELADTPSGIVAVPSGTRTSPTAMPPPLDVITVVLDDAVAAAVFLPGFAEVIGAAQVMHLREQQALVLELNVQATYVAEMLMRRGVLTEVDGVAAALTVLRDGAEETLDEARTALETVRHDDQQRLINDRDGIRSVPAA